MKPVANKLISFCNGLFILATLLSILVQYNDPDPFTWAIFYACAMAIAVRRQLKGPTLVWLNLILLAWSLAWITYLVPQFYGQLDQDKLATVGGMNYLGVEEAREAGGAVIVAFWMLILSLEKFAGKVSSA